MLTEPSEADKLDALLQQFAQNLQQLAEGVGSLARELEQRPPRPIPLRPWWDAPVRGLPLEEALKECAEGSVA